MHYLRKLRSEMAALEQQQEAVEAEEEKERLAHELERRAWAAQRREKLEEEKRQADLRRMDELATLLDQVDEERLSLHTYPTDAELQEAITRREYNQIAFVVTAVSLFLGLINSAFFWIAALLGMASLGLLGWYIMGPLPRYGHLIKQRFLLIHGVRSYIRSLENAGRGKYGLAVCLYRLREFNDAMDQHAFKKLLVWSSRGELGNRIRSIDNLQLYHQYMIEGFVAAVNFREMLAQTGQPQAIADAESKLQAHEQSQDENNGLTEGNETNTTDEAESPGNNNSATETKTTAKTMTEPAATEQKPEAKPESNTEPKTSPPPTSAEKLPQQS